MINLAYKDSDRFRKRLLTIIYIPAALALCLSFGGFDYSPAIFPSLFFFGGIVGMIIMTLGYFPEVFVECRNDKIILGYGLLNFVLISIPVNDILAIGSLPCPASDYFFSPVYSIFPKNGDWIGLIATTSGGALAIVTKEKKYIISCPFAEKAAKSIAELYGVKEKIADPPKLLRLRRSSLHDTSSGTREK